MKLRVIKKADNTVIVFGEWFDSLYGNTYYDARVITAGKAYEIAYKYGYNAGDTQSIDEALAACGLRVRKGQGLAGYSSVVCFTVAKLKRELFKK